MGRKIPSKKHRGVKDPLEQHARRLQSLKGKINAPPKDPDEQPIPKSLERLFAFQNKKQHNPAEKNKKHKNIHRGNSESERIDNPIAKLKKIPGESGRSFSLRINNAIKTLTNPSEELDFPDDVEERDFKGDRMAAQRERRQRKNPKSAEASEQLSRSQKRAARIKAKKEAKDAQQTRPELVYERVGFGEVTHAPPALSVKPRHCRGDGTAARPGRRTLLLSPLLRGEGPAENARADADAARRERARLDVVAAYRALKKQNRERDKRARPSTR